MDSKVQRFERRPFVREKLLKVIENKIYKQDILKVSDLLIVFFRLNILREIQAFFEDTPGLQYMASQQEDCNLKVVGKSFGNSGYGMPFRPNSSWVKGISAALREMHEDGTIIKLTGKWLESACVRKKKVQIAERLGIKDQSGNLLLMAVFCVGSFLLLAMEIAFKKVYSNICLTHSGLSSSYSLTPSRNTSADFQNFSEFLEFSEIYRNY